MPKAPRPPSTQVAPANSRCRGRRSPRGPREARDTPDLAGLLLDGLHGALHRAEQRLDLTGRLLQKEARHKLVHVAPALVHLWREGAQMREGLRRELRGGGLAQSWGGTWGWCLPRRRKWGPQGHPRLGDNRAPASGHRLWVWRRGRSPWLHRVLAAPLWDGDRSPPSIHLTRSSAGLNDDTDIKCSGSCPSQSKGSVTSSCGDRDEADAGNTDGGEDDGRDNSMVAAVVVVAVTVAAVTVLSARGQGREDDAGEGWQGRGCSPGTGRITPGEHTPHPLPPPRTSPRAPGPPCAPQRSGRRLKSDQRGSTGPCQGKAGDAVSGGGGSREDGGGGGTGRRRLRGHEGSTVGGGGGGFPQSLLCGGRRNRPVCQEPAAKTFLKAPGPEESPAASEGGRWD